VTPAPARRLAAVALALLAGCGDDRVADPEPIPGESPFRYPIALWDARAEGSAVVMVHVTDMGGVDSVYVLESSGDPGFDSAALSGARELRFTPGRRGEDRVAMWARLPVHFRLPPDSVMGGVP